MCKQTGEDGPRCITHKHSRDSWGRIVLPKGGGGARSQSDPAVSTASGLSLRFSAILTWTRLGDDIAQCCHHVDLLKVLDVWTDPHWSPSEHWAPNKTAPTLRLDRKIHITSLFPWQQLNRQRFSQPKILWILFERWINCCSLGAAVLKRTIQAF